MNDIILIKTKTDKWYALDETITYIARDNNDWVVQRITVADYIPNEDLYPMNAIVMLSKEYDPEDPSIMLNIDIYLTKIAWVCCSLGADYSESLYNHLFKDYFWIYEKIEELIIKSKNGTKMSKIIQRVNKIVFNKITHYRIPKEHSWMNDYPIKIKAEDRVAFYGIRSETAYICDDVVHFEVIKDNSTDIKNVKYRSSKGIYTIDREYRSNKAFMDSIDWGIYEIEYFAQRLRKYSVTSSIENHVLYYNSAVHDLLTNLNGLSVDMFVAALNTVRYFAVKYLLNYLKLSHLDFSINLSGQELADYFKVPYSYKNIKYIPKEYDINSAVRFSNNIELTKEIGTKDDDFDYISLRMSITAIVTDKYDFIAKYKNAIIRHAIEFINNSLEEEYSLSFIKMVMMMHNKGAILIFKKQEAE